MDGQNFQNDQNGQVTENTSTGNYYQDNTNQYTGSVYTEPVVENNSGNTPGLAIAALVMGILSIVLSCCCGVGIIFGIAGLIMSIVANKQNKSGVGTAGLVCSIIGIVFSGISLIYYFAVGGLSMLAGF